MTAEQTPDIEALAVNICSHSGRHTAGDGDHDAEHWGACSQCKHYARVVAPILAAAVREAEQRAWLQGYEFALRNLQDEAVQADLQRLTAGVNAGPGVVSVPPDGAADAPNKAKGALAQQPPAPAVDYRADRIAVDAPEGGASICRHGDTDGSCASCAACAACRGECGTCPYGGAL